MADSARRSFVRFHEFQPYVPETKVLRHTAYNIITKQQGCVFKK